MEDLIWSRESGTTRYAFEINELSSFFKKKKMLANAFDGPSVTRAGFNKTIVQNAILLSMLAGLAALIIYYFSVIDF